MSEELESAIAAVKINQYSFCKIITPNDAGMTGAHQAGLYIPKNSVQLLFNEPGITGQNKDKVANIQWYNGINVQCRFIYYGQGTRDEYRITRLGRHFKVDELVIIVKQTEDNYLGFTLDETAEIHTFLGEFKLNRNNLNTLIPSENHSTKAESVISSVLEEQLQVGTRKNINFKPKANILVLLGEELIRSPVMAIYELIKNGYDADAKEIDVIFENIEDINHAKITVLDDGTGITEKVLKEVWFEPGTDFRKPIDSNGKRKIKRTPIYNRIPMGEKGVGRFAVHKLGNVIKLVSRPAKIILDEENNFVKTELLNYELTVEIDWRSFSQQKYLDDINIKWEQNYDTELFRFKYHHGTYIEISSLKEEWTRGMARQLKRNTVSMVSPQNSPSKFNIQLTFNNWWIDNIPETNDILEQAPYRLIASVDKDYNLIFYYCFSLYNNNELGSRVIDNNDINGIDSSKFKKNIKYELRKTFETYLEDKEYEKDTIDEFITKYLTPEIPYGGLTLELYSYDLDSTSLRDSTTDSKLVKDLLKEQAGVKVFKGDLRVYDYGDPGNDWLGLDLKRVQNKEWFSNNQNIGFVYLDPSSSGALIEKTNREGFIQNAAYDHFKVVLEYLLKEFRAERQSDRARWLKYNKKVSTNSFDKQLSGFKHIISQLNLPLEDKQKLVDEANKLEQRYEQDKNTLLIPAGVGMTASFAMHEIEKLVPRMKESVRDNPINRNRITAQVDELKDYTEGILSVIRKSGNKPISLIESINQAINNYASRIRSRKINIEIDHDSSIESIICDKRLLITMLMNLLDNSIYWLDTIYKQDKSIYISTYREVNSVSILIVDNGPGFKDKVEDLIMPYFTRKEKGIGIGLYLIDTIMIQYGKLKIIEDKAFLKEKGVPDLYSGAAVELVFNKHI